jgi:hypothetical protein
VFEGPHVIVTVFAIEFIEVTGVGGVSGTFAASKLTEAL